MLLKYEARVYKLSEQSRAILQETKLIDSLIVKNFHYCLLLMYNYSLNESVVAQNTLTPNTSFIPLQPEMVELYQLVTKLFKYSFNTKCFNKFHIKSSCHVHKNLNIWNVFYHLILIANFLKPLFAVITISVNTMRASIQKLWSNFFVAFDVRFYDIR